MQSTCHFLFPRLSFLGVTNMEDQCNAVLDVQAAQVPLDYIMMRSRMINIASASSGRLGWARSQHQLICMSGTRDGID